MTVVRVLVQTPAVGGVSAAVGVLRWQPTARRVVPSEGLLPAAVVLPASFSVPLVAGAVDVDVEPTGAGWVWCVVESFSGAPAKRRYFQVPDVASIDYADLVEIDPDTLAREPSAAPAWNQPLTELDTRLSAGVITPDPDDPGFFVIGA